MFKCIEASNIKIVLCRYRKSQQDVLVKLENIHAKIEVVRKYMEYPVTFTISDNKESNNNIIDTTYNKYCKFALGVSKYSSNTLSLAELGKYPLSFKSTSLSVAYWLRMIHGSENIMLNKAYNEMKLENLKWLEDIKSFLYSVGLGNMWLHPHKWSINAGKKQVRQRLNDMYLQKYNEYITSGENVEKCHVNNLCINTSEYKMKGYLETVRCPTVRTSITKYRIDANNTLDCKLRSFRFKSICSNICERCLVRDDVKHKLLYCYKTDSARNIFLNSMSSYVKNFNQCSDKEKIHQILNVSPKCKEKDTTNAITSIVKYIRDIYYI